MKNLVIFGASDIAELAHYYFSRASPYKVVAFTVDRPYLDRSVWHDCPVVAFEDVESRFPPASHAMFVALSYTQRNMLRATKYAAAKAKGYLLANFVSPDAVVSDTATLGDNCLVLEHNTIQPYVCIGNDVTLWSGNHIGHHTVIGDHTFVSSHVVIAGRVEVGPYCFLGINSAIGNGLTLGAETTVGAGALILRNTEPGSVNPGGASRPRRVRGARLPFFRTGDKRSMS